MDTVKSNIKKILESKASESNTLDYKSKEYTKDGLSDFFRDTISFLNSNESYGKDKYIIFGVSNGGNLTGLNGDMRDGNEYQDLADKISNRPEIISGQMKFQDADIGYIFIPGEDNKNSNRVYEMKKDYGSSIRKFVGERQGFIRKGSVNYALTELERREIHEEMILSGHSKENDISLEIAAKKKFNKEKYETTDKEGIIEFECENNGHLFSVINEEFIFLLNWYTLNKDVALIRVGNGEDIGYLNKSTSWPPSTHINDYDDINSHDRTIHKNESFIMINRHEKIIGIRLLSADSKAHGDLKDKVVFEFKCID